MDWSLGEVARPCGDQDPVPVPPFSKLSPSTQPHLSLLGAALEDSHMSQASCQKRQLAWEERGKAHSRPGEEQAGPVTCSLERVPGGSAAWWKLDSLRVG